MHPTKQRKPAKTKISAVPVRDLRPTKDAKAGGQKKEGPTVTTITSLS